MVFIKFRDIKKLETKVDLVYHGYTIKIERNDEIITIRIDSDIDKVEVLKIIKDKDYNGCLMDFINIMLKPYLDIAIEDLRDIEKKL